MKAKHQENEHKCAFEVIVNKMFKIKSEVCNETFQGCYFRDVKKTHLKKVHGGNLLSW